MVVSIVYAAGSNIVLKEVLSDSATFFLRF